MKEKKVLKQSIQMPKLPYIHSNQYINIFYTKWQTTLLKEEPKSGAKLRYN